jgi:hypothetical protein
MKKKIAQVSSIKRDDGNRRDRHEGMLSPKKNHNFFKHESFTRFFLRTAPFTQKALGFMVVLLISIALIYVQMSSVNRGCGETNSMRTHPKNRKKDDSHTDLIDDLASTEDFPMKKNFYAWSTDLKDDSVTIIFNVFRGRPGTLHKQLVQAARQVNISPPQIWVNSFNTSHSETFKTVVEKFNSFTTSELNYPGRVEFTSSTFNYKFHGRFFLAYMAKTKYVMIVDDDVMLEESIVSRFIDNMKRQRGVWGIKGHVGGSSLRDYKLWPERGFNRIEKNDYIEVDYLCGLWFIEQSWLEYFFKERMPSFETAEDMHLSHTMRKYLNLNSYGAFMNLTFSRSIAQKKGHHATNGAARRIREEIFQHSIGRGNKISKAPHSIKTLVYAETVGHIQDFISKLDKCKYTWTSNPWCVNELGPIAVVFRGAKEQDVQGLIQASKKLCQRTKCAYTIVKSLDLKSTIEYFNMREGFGQNEEDIPWQTATSDVLTSLVGILNNLTPSFFFLPQVSGASFDQDLIITKSIRRNRLDIYHNTVRLAVQIHMNQETNAKWDSNGQKDLLQSHGSFFSFPSMQTYIYHPNRTEYEELVF